MVARTQFILDPQIFEAASEMAMDPTAAVVARVQAVRILYSQLIPGSLDTYEQFVREDQPLGGTVIDGRAPWDRLPISALRQTEARLRELLADEQTPTPLRNAVDNLFPSVIIELYCDGVTPALGLRECVKVLEEKEPPRQ